MAVVVICKGQLILAFTTKEAFGAFIINLNSMRQKLELQSNLCNSEALVLICLRPLGTMYILCPYAGSWLRQVRKLESILHCNNGITVVNKAGIRAPTVAFAEDPSNFPFRVSHHHLKKRTSTPTPPKFSGHLCMHVHTSLAH